MDPKRKLSPGAGALLDVARAAAAGYVVLHHLAAARGWSGPAFLALRFGQEAVIVFFLLSGFVIFANERDRVRDLAGFYRRRLERIYPVLVVAMILSVLVAWDSGTLALQFRLPELLGTLVGLQDIATLKPGVLVSPFMGNEPLWSLSYEMAFYAAFPLVMALWRRYPQRADHVVGIVCLAGYALFALWPNHWTLVVAYFQIWWCGAAAARAYGDGVRSRLAFAGPLGWLVALAGLAAAVVVLVGPNGLGLYPVLPFRHFAFAAAALALVFGPLGARLARGSLPFARPAAAIAAISYGVYAFHYPLLVAWPRARPVEGAILAAFLLVALAWIFDLRVARWLAARRRARARIAEPTLAAGDGGAGLRRS